MNKTETADFIKTLTTRPGVYRMYDKDGAIIYVGKAKNLKSRVRSYFRATQDSAKTQAMVRHIASIDVTVTETEADALLLESNLIKQFRPKYNVLFRDDKSYPYLHLSTDQDFPRFDFYRGTRKRKGRYFGPYPGAGSARQILNLVQKLFRLRQCDDSFFRNRQRPCLQYQIKRCSAPCVGYIRQQDYAKDIELATLFLQGESDLVIKALTTPMQEAAEKLEYERAASYRDQIKMLRQLQEARHIVSKTGNADIIGCAVSGEQACIQVFYIRDGYNLGNKTWYPRVRMGEQASIIIEHFIKQYYISSLARESIPTTVYVSHKPEDSILLEKVLTAKKKQDVSIRDRGRADKAKWIEMARDNAQLALQQYRAQHLKYRDRLQHLTEFLGKEDPVARIECFDISHISGDNTVASCVVFSEEGPLKSDYRRFNITDITRGDDYAAMSQVIGRRYARIKAGEGKLPELILIDGGKGQVSHAMGALRELQLDNAVSVLGIAKGPSRKNGMETLILSDGKKQIRLQEDSAMLHLLQEVRDEAHRFAITGHRQRRKKNQKRSILDDIKGIGSKRRQKLVQHFGGMQEISNARLEELARVPGINKNLAQKIYEALHSS
ncbi:MAG: excinuclease ABC subunit UvrC [Gammaproteobacteria bacterium]